jgi:hypothetical protein
MRERHISMIGLIVFAALFLLVIVTISPDAEAVVEYRTNDDSDNAIWIEAPATLSEVHVWNGWGADNAEDWWMFNASAGKDVQINFRKYDNWEDPQDPFESGTYSLNYRVYTSTLSEIYRYSRTYDNNPDDSYKRDSWSYIVPENLEDKFYIRVFVTNNNRNGYYWLNLTVEDPRDLNAASQYDGVLDINRSYTADYDPVDYFLVDLDAGDFITLDFDKTDAAADLILEVWETIPFGFSEADHMLNRTGTGVATHLTIRFLATHDGTYVVRAMRSFWEGGSSNYTLSITFGTRANDPDGLAADGKDISYVQKLRDQTIEMGYDTHDWYKVHILEGDTIFKVIVDINDANVGNGQGYEVVVYNEAGNVRWAQSSVRTGPTYDDEIIVPPTGTTTIFDANETLYVRVSADAGATDRAIKGFRSLYDIEFVLTNRAPVLLVPFNQTYVWEEDGGVIINLNAHFFDPDGDTMEYFLMNRTTGWVYDVTGLSYWGWLNVTSPPEWSGNLSWTLKAQDAGQDGDDHKIFVVFNWSVLAVPDLPISNGTLKRQCNEEESSSANLNKLFYDVDAGQGGLLTFGYTDTGIDNVQVVLDGVTGEVDLIPDPDVFGTFLFEFYCHDDTNDNVVGHIELKVVGLNDIPRISGPIDTIRLNEGGDAVEMNMSHYFYDVDNDVLQYSYLVPSSASGVINVYHKGYEVTDHRVIIELTNDGFYGTVLVNVTCKDSQGTLVKQDMLIVVTNVPDAPTIDHFPVGNPSAIEETDSITFKVTDVVDPDIPEEGLHTYTWYFDSVLVPDHNQSEFVFSPGYDDAGSHSVKVVVTDPSGLKAPTEPTWTFMVTDKNRIPTVTITTPPETVDEGKKVTLTADGTDPDSDDLIYTWYLVGTEEKVLGTGKTIETKDLKAGSRKVEVEVSDGKGGTTKASTTIKVNAVEEGSGINMMYIIIIVVVLVAVMAVVMMMRKGKGEAKPEARMDLESLQQDYDPSQGRGGGEGGQTYESANGDWESMQDK